MQDVGHVDLLDVAVLWMSGWLADIGHAGSRAWLHIWFCIVRFSS